jgi:hypothetical protein
LKSIFFLKVLQVNLDKCQSKRLTLTNMDELIADLSIKGDVKLSIGGVPTEISKNDYYYSTLNVYEYEGCIRNVRINSQLRDLKLNGNKNNNLASENCDCKYQLKQPADCINSGKVVTPGPEFPWWIILIVIAALILLGMIYLYFYYKLNFEIQLAKLIIDLGFLKLFYIFLFK